MKQMFGLLIQTHFLPIQRSLAGCEPPQEDAQNPCYFVVAQRTVTKLVSPVSSQAILCLTCCLLHMHHAPH